MHCCNKSKSRTFPLNPDAAEVTIDGNLSIYASFQNALCTSFVVEDNFVASPIGISALMAIVQAGATGKTAEEIRRSMKFPANNDQLRKGYYSILETLQRQNQITFEMFNGFYYKDDFELQTDFITTLEDYYNVDPQVVNFKEIEKSAQIINHHVMAHLKHGNILDVISESELRKEIKLVLVNAVYFKGRWKIPFKKKNTKIDTFHVSDEIGDAILVNMMKMTNILSYSNIPELDAQCVALPYKNRMFSMIVIVPNTRAGLPQLEKQLGTYGLQKVIQNLRRKKVVLSLPQFKVDSAIDLKETLEYLDNGVIFTSNGELSGISPAVGVCVSEVAHRVFLEVNEDGTVAAALNSFDKLALFEPLNSQNCAVTANHPFYFAIIADMGITKGQHYFPLLTGRIVNPPKVSLACMTYHNVLGE